jgi:hypothetical protein
MPGLVPGIHALLCVGEGVDGRDNKPGHDERWVLAERTRGFTLAERTRDGAIDRYNGDYWIARFRGDDG